jgi:1-deoxy-D-xylulose-5-phosphate synthase
MRCIPNMVIATPSDENECRTLLTTAYHHKGPAAVRYPRGTGVGVEIEKELNTVAIGKARLIRDGKKVAILNFGTLLPLAMHVAQTVNAQVFDMRFVKPLDTDLLENLATQCDLLVTLEENSVLGGAGSAVNEYLAQIGILTPVMIFGLPDKLMEHGNREQLLEKIGLTPDNILNAIADRLKGISGKDKAAL